MQSAPDFKLKPLPAMLAVVLGSTTLSAQAVVINTSAATVDSSYSINGGPVISLSESSPPAAMANIIQSASSGGVSILTHPYVFVPQLIFGNRASGDIFGGTGSYEANASVVLDLDVDVPAGGDTFSFTLQAGEVGVTGPASGLSGADFLFAGLDLLIEDVSVPGSPLELFSSSYEVESTSAGTTATQLGTALGPACSIAGASGAMCDIVGASYNLSLADTVSSLRYTLSMRAAGELLDVVGGYDDCGSGGSEGSGEFELQFDEEEGGGTGGPCGSIVRTGDPIANVPEPASIALSTLGLAAMGLARRRRTRRT